MAKKLDNSNYTRVKEISIQNFRAIEAGAIFPLGPNITLIAGQNGTSKSTLLGILAQPLGFPERSKADSKYTTTYHGINLLTIRTLTGDRFKANYSDVFRTSVKYDKPRSHQYTIFLNGEAINPDSKIADEGLSVQSEGREDQATNKLRFVTTSSSRTRGEGNFPHPVIFLGLDRLRPLAKCEKVTKSEHIFKLDDDLQYWINEYKKILNYLPQENILPELIDTGKAKGNYQSVRANNHDSESASAGQDNLGQILTAIMSFRQLKRELADRYRGGLLLIDEVDATLHPTSQELLFDFLVSASKELGIQIVATTHSLTMLQYADKQSIRNAAQLVYLQKRAGNVKIVADIDFEFIEKDLANIRRKTISNSIKTTVLFEDNVACSFFKALTGRLFSSYISTHTTAKNNRDTSLSNGVLSAIAKCKIPEFKKIIFVLDPDSQNFVTSSSKNLLALPGNGALEIMMYHFLAGLSDDDQCWDNVLKCSQQECFTGYNNLVQGKKEINKYKAWFKKCVNKNFFDKGNQALYKLWLQHNSDLCKKFSLQFLDALKAVKNISATIDYVEIQKSIEKKYE